MSKLTIYNTLISVIAGSTSIFLGNSSKSVNSEKLQISVQNKEKKIINLEEGEILDISGPNGNHKGCSKKIGDSYPSCKEFPNTVEINWEGKRINILRSDIEKNVRKLQQGYRRTLISHKDKTISKWDCDTPKQNSKDQKWEITCAKSISPLITR